MSAKGNVGFVYILLFVEFIFLMALGVAISASDKDFCLQQKITAWVFHVHFTFIAIDNII